MINAPLRPTMFDALELLARIADMHSDRAPDDLILWSNNVKQPETVLTLGHVRAVRAALTYNQNRPAMTPIQNEASAI